ncbi:hypothetical protein HK405_006620 [Cladochytrium tenue]|nr:hypothetical protein HK405_006620 [Cladochytrium tenue]
MAVAVAGGSARESRRRSLRRLLERATLAFPPPPPQRPPPAPASPLRSSAAARPPVVIVAKSHPPRMVVPFRPPPASPSPFEPSSGQPSLLAPSADPAVASVEKFGGATVSAAAAAEIGAIVSAKVRLVSASVPFARPSTTTGVDVALDVLSALGLGDPSDATVRRLLRNDSPDDVAAALEADFWAAARDLDAARTVASDMPGADAAVAVAGDALWRAYLALAMANAPRAAGGSAAVLPRVLDFLATCDDGVVLAVRERRAAAIMDDMERLHASGAAVPVHAAAAAAMVRMLDRAGILAAEPDRCVRLAAARGLEACRALHTHFVRAACPEGTVALVQHLSRNVLGSTSAPFSDSRLCRRRHRQSTTAPASNPTASWRPLVEFCFRALADVSDADGIAQLHRDMRARLAEAGRSLPLACYESILATLCHRRHLSAHSVGLAAATVGDAAPRIPTLPVAEAIFREALSFFPASQRLYNLMLKAALRLERRGVEYNRYSQDLLFEMRRLRLHLAPDSSAFLVSIYAQSGKADSIEILWKETHQNAMALGASSQSGSSQLLAAPDLTVETPAHERPPVVLQRDALQRLPELNGLRTSERPARKSMPYEDLCQWKMWQGLLVGLATSRKWRMAAEALEAMHQGGFKPSRRLYERVLEESSMHAPGFTLQFYKSYQSDGYKDTKRVRLALETVSQKTSLGGSKEAVDDERSRAETAATVDEERLPRFAGP